ncbi:carbohydrate ABC transporter substrate-binding protein [Streptomyces sp. NPDC050560]|uniref:carbohydrate ABC transporter substrate-binding protein n=1 Tax=Streptomyces sp. NPDC050560 TaxID=3365630 RepID=UPI0037AE775C
MTAALTGMTWDHPRGHRVLDALTERDRAAPAAGYAPVTWRRHSLEDFEARPLRTFCDEADLVVLDHPGLGEAVADGCLRPLDTLFTPGELAALAAESAGPSFASYHHEGRQWALPVDAATQVSVVRADVARRPGTWAEALAAARELPTALCLGGPHAFLMFAAVCTALGAPPCQTRDRVVDPAVGAAALDLMAELLDAADPGLSLRNPIAVLDAMAAPGGPAYCPLVYGYVTYQGALRAFDAPRGVGGRGSVLGGVGMAVTRSCTDPDQARAHLLRLLGPEVQTSLYPDLGGQASTAAAWRDPVVNAAAHGFYRDTQDTLDTAWTRPRFAGFVPFQQGAAATIRDGLAERTTPARVLARLDAAFHEAHRTAPHAAHTTGDSS